MLRPYRHVPFDTLQETAGKLFTLIQVCVNQNYPYLALGYRRELRRVSREIDLRKGKKQWW